MFDAAIIIIQLFIIDFAFKWSHYAASTVSAFDLAPFKSILFNILYNLNCSSVYHDIWKTSIF
jgi:hypothetical protein